MTSVPVILSKLIAVVMSIHIYCDFDSGSVLIQTRCIVIPCVVFFGYILTCFHIVESSIYLYFVMFLQTLKMLLRKRLFFFFSLCVTVIGVFTTHSWIVNVYQDSFSSTNESLCACDKCLMEYDPWLAELMRASPEPFLSTKNNISLSVFNYWKRKQFDRSSFSFFNNTVDKVFQIFPPNVNFTRSSPDLCRTCAVVGNSGNLNGSHYGPLIDFHDIVIRMNHAPTKGFERDVGRRTTHHVMYPHSSRNLDNNTHLVFFPFKTAHLQWLITSFTEKQKPRNDSQSKAKKDVDTGIEANKDLVMILSPEFMRYVHITWLQKKGWYPSTGFLTVILSLHMCDEISLFGFGADRHGNWNHYFERLKNRRLKTGQHPGNHEFNLINKLNSRKKIRFFRGW